MKHEIPVSFAGDGSGVSELTWAQHNIWKMMVRFGGDPVMVGGTMPLEPGTTVEHIKHLLAFIVSRHHSLRTRIRSEPDGSRRQVLHSEGEVALEIIDIGADEDPAEAGEAVRARFEESPFDIEKEWPVRMAVIRQDGVPVWFTAMYPHMAIDGYGFEALIRDLEHLDRETGEQLAPRTGIQPFQIAEQEATAASRRRSASAIRHWERLLSQVSTRRFNGPHPREDPQWWDLTTDSPAAYLAVTSIAARTGLDTGPILLGAWAVAMARVTGLNPSVIRILVSNRFRSDFAESVTVLTQPSLCVVDVAGVTFDQVAVRAWRSQFTAGKHGYYDPRDLWPLLDRVNAERGEEVDLMCYFNDGRRALAVPRPGPLPTVAELAAAVPLTRYERGIKTNVPDVKAVMDLNPAPDTINFLIRIDTADVTPQEQEVLAREVVGILVAAAFDPDCPSGID